jgi:hypothetical protein
MSRRLEQALQRLGQSVQRTLRVHDPANRIVVVSDTGLAVEDALLEETVWSVRWDAIEEIIAFKRDMLTVDDLCLGILPLGGRSYHVCDEDMPGWAEANRALERRFGIRFAEWFPAVAHPAFAENTTVLWRRAGS